MPTPITFLSCAQLSMRELSRVRDMKVTNRRVSFFESRNRADVIRSDAGGAYARIAHGSGATTSRGPAADF